MCNAALAMTQAFALLKSAILKRDTKMVYSTECFLSLIEL